MGTRSYMLWFVLSVLVAVPAFAEGEQVQAPEVPKEPVTLGDVSDLDDQILKLRKNLEIEDLQIKMEELQKRREALDNPTDINSAQRDAGENIGWGPDVVPGQGYLPVVSSIYGTDKLTAVLVYPDGSEAKVWENDPLPSGLQVKKITSRGVTVSKDDKLFPLRFGTVDDTNIQERGNAVQQ